MSRCFLIKIRELKMNSLLSLINHLDLTIVFVQINPVHFIIAKHDRNKNEPIFNWTMIIINGFAHRLFAFWYCNFTYGYTYFNLCPRRNRPQQNSRRCLWKHFVNNFETIIKWRWTHCGKRWTFFHYQAISPFVTVCSKVFRCRDVRTRLN